VVSLALRELERELKSGNREQLLEQLQNELIYQVEAERWRHDQTGSQPEA
jgi:hypothetical protein